jgi:hypothetical protein
MFDIDEIGKIDHARQVLDFLAGSSSQEYERKNMFEAENLHWFKSTFSTPASCVEIAHLPNGGVAVRNSRTPDGAKLTYTGNEWDAFLLGARAGEFDRPGDPT